MAGKPLGNGTAAPNRRVTVFIPAYNVEAYIAEAIESVLAQTFTNFTLLIIDDASTDNTLSVIQSYTDDPRLQVVTHEQNLGRPVTRNEGLDLARTEFIAFLDADDKCTTQRLARQVSYLDSHIDIDGVGSWKTCIDEKGCPAPEGVRKYPLGHHEIACQMLVECPIGQTSLTMRLNAFARYRYDVEFVVAQDYELWARMIETCRFANLPEALTYYRQHPKQSSSTKSHTQRTMDLEIYGRQIDRLGVRNATHDLLMHERFFKFSSRDSVLEHTGKPLDIEYVRWARRWLGALREGNAKNRIYPEPEFSRTLSARWLFAARKAVRNSGPWLVALELIKCKLTLVALIHPALQFKKT